MTWVYSSWTTGEVVPINGAEITGVFGFLKIIHGQPRCYVRLDGHPIIVGELYKRRNMIGVDVLC